MIDTIIVGVGLIIGSIVPNNRFDSAYDKDRTKGDINGCR
jgi:hypothetical protein